MSKHSAKGPAWERMKRRVFALHGRYCVYCGNDADTIDHLHPRSDTAHWELTGLDPDAIENLAPACRSCNSIKSNNKRKRVNYFNPAYLRSI